MIKKWMLAALMSALVLALSISLSGAPALASGVPPSGGSGYIGWYFQDTGLTGVNDVSAANADVVWAVGSKVLKSADGGDTWSDSWPGHDGSYSGVCAIDTNTVWVTQASDRVIKTDNGGSDWAESTTGTGSNLTDIVGIDSNNAWAIGSSPNKIFRTTTGGASWESFWRPGWGSQALSITAVSATTAWVSFYNGSVAKTVDGGGNWSVMSVNSYAEGIDALDANTLYVCGWETYKSTNGGDTWRKVLQRDEWLDDIAVVSTNTAWAVAVDGGIVKTTDGGKSWYEQKSGTTAWLHNVCAVDSNNAWACSATNGYVLHTNDGGGYHTPPAISTIAPSSGRAGAEVTIRGSEFGATRSQSYVSFGATEATEYTTWTGTRIGVVVPEGVSGQVNLAVHTAGGASNAKTFTVITPTYYSYFFAEGCTREGFAEWLCLQNPGTGRLEVTATYMLMGGQAPVVRTYALEATSRTSVNVSDAVGPGQDVSVKLVAEGEFYAERPMYFDYKQGQAGYSWTGGHCATGASAPAGDWYFAEGTTRPGFEEWICLQNPGSSTVTATVYYIMAGAYTTQKDYRLSAQSRLSVFVNGDVGPDQDVSVRVHCDSGIVAERPMYFDYHDKWTGGHDVMGTDSPKATWYFAEGSTQPGFEEWLAVQNANNQNATMTCHFLKSDGTQDDKSYTVGANSRWTLDVRQAVGVGVDSAIVLESNMPVVAERPMYFCYKDGQPAYSWTGGHDVVGAPATKTSWFFAEGCTYDWADEYICVANPGADSAHVTFSFMLESGSPVQHTIDIAAHMRATVKVADIVGRGHDVSARITSSKPVVAERPMYFSYNGWTGGHDVVGF